MPFWGCEWCGVALNDMELRDEPGVASPAQTDWRKCPQCGRALRRVSVSEARELVRERAEAERWRAAAGSANRRAGSPA